jgi:hypothetical protein
MQIGHLEKWTNGGKTLEVHRRFDSQPVIDSVKQLKEAGCDHLAGNPDMKLAGRVPMHIYSEWIKDAGLSWTDGPAIRDMLRTKLMSGEFDKLRVWEGSW